MLRPTQYLSYLIVVIFAVACLVALRGDLAHVSFVPLIRGWDLILLAVGLSLGNYVMRIIRWRQYLARLGHRLPLGFVALTYLAGFAFTLSPGKVGEMVRARYYMRSGVALADVAGAFFVERLMDLLAMIFLAALIVTAVPRYRAVIWVTSAVVAVVFVALRSNLWGRLAQYVQTHPRVPRLIARLSVRVADALEAARVLLSPSILAIGLLASLAAWGFEGVGFYWLADIFAPSHVTVTAGVGIYAVAVLVGAVSFLPGGLGSTEAVMTAILSTQGYSVADALLVTITCRLVTLWLGVGVGWLAVLALGRVPGPEGTASASAMPPAGATAPSAEAAGSVGGPGLE